MKKELLILVISFGLICGNVYADNIITYGKSTYNEVGDRIIFGSYGDEYSVSEFDNLGANDWIAELNFKNVLAYEGYTEAYDYNPKYDGYYSNFYHKPLPVKDLTKISIRGLGANPREVQDVYVLTSEYEKYSSQGQDNRIIANTDNIIINKDNITSNYNKNKTQDIDIRTNSNNINTNARKIKGLDNRLSELEETQMIVGLEGRIYDSKKWQVNIFADYSTNRNKIDRTGIRFTYKFGKSFEERKIEELEKKLNKLIKEN